VANFTNLPIDAAGSYTITATDGAHTAWTRPRARSPSSPPHEQDRHYEPARASVTAGTSASMSVSIEDTYAMSHFDDSISVALTPSASWRHDDRDATGGWPLHELAN